MRIPMQAATDSPARSAGGRWPAAFAAWLMLLAALCCLAPRALAATDPCAGIAHCQNLGPFIAQVIKVNVTRQDRPTAYQGVRTTLRFTNIGRTPLLLGYRDHTSVVTDDKGLPYRYSAKAYGIGVVSRDAADAQFELAPGESREASFDGVLQYSMRSTVAGTVFNHDITIVQLAPQGGRQVREARDFALNFSGLTATSGFLAGGPRAGVETQAAAQTTTTTSSPTPPPAVNGDPCAGAPACQSQGPFMATVVRVNVTDTGNATAYHGVRTTVRFRNLGDRPLILGYRSGQVTDNAGLVYRYASKAQGIGVVDANQADPQFQLAPGESREATFDGVLQYSRRAAVQPGNVFSFDLTVSQLEVVGPRQVRATHDFALNFSDLSGSGALASVGGDSRNAAEAVGKVVDLFKSLKK